MYSVQFSDLQAARATKTILSLKVLQSEAKILMFSCSSVIIPFEYVTW